LSADTTAAKHREAGLDEFGSWPVDAVLRASPAGMAFIDADQRFVWANLALARMFGREPADFSGQPLTAALPPVEAVRAQAALRLVLANGEPVTETFAAGPVAGPVAGTAPGSADPQHGPLVFHWFPVQGTDDKDGGAGLIVTAGGTGPATEEALRRSEERYRALVQGGAQIIWVASPEGEMLEDSAEWRWITGQSVEQFLGSGWLDSIHPEDRERVERDWHECLRTGRVFDDRFRMRTRNGSYRHYDVRAVPIERDGKIAEWVGACTDVTSQREAEEMRGRLTDQLSAAALRTARLQQATAMLAEALDVEQVVEVITEVGRTAIGALRSAVALLDDEKLGLRVVNPDGLAPVGPDAAGTRLTLDTPSVMTRAIATRRPVLISDPQELRAQFDPDLGDHKPDGADLDGKLPDERVPDERVPDERVPDERVPDGRFADNRAADNRAADSTALAARPGRVLETGDEQAWVGLPLLAAGMPLGALRFSFGKPRTITEEERVFLEALAGQCALAVERAEMYEKEHAAAVTLQRSLLPDKLPSVSGLELDAKYLPRTTEVGGDWYDVFRLPDRRLAVTVGDVMGKGLHAAAGMGRVRNALRALALTDPRPAAVLAGLDRLFTATEREEQVTTVTYLVIDPETGEGQAGNAGHPPTLLLTPGALPVLDGAEAGTPLGWASPRRQHAFRLPPGSTAVFYSDGLVENRVRGIDAGLDELVRVAADAPQDLAGTPGLLIQYLLDNMLAGHEQDDDVTVLVMHVPAVGGTGQAGGAGQDGGARDAEQRAQR
jgi:PAS domain S-box-containing protein